MDCRKHMWKNIQMYSLISQLQDWIWIFRHTYNNLYFFNHFNFLLFTTLFCIGQKTSRIWIKTAPEIVLNYDLQTSNTGEHLRPINYSHVWISSSQNSQMFQFNIWVTHFQMPPDEFPFLIRICACLGAIQIILDTFWAC